MSDEERKYLLDMLEACRYIQTKAVSLTSYKTYVDSDTLKFAIERKLEVVGEAMSKLNKLNPDISIESKHQIISVRNRLIHSGRCHDVWHCAQPFEWAC